ncbi:MAG: hypothetical protein IJU56_04475 [Clostridia bacterium]|nr:hypothetical protein [Clostridia bacterium]
MIDWFRQYWPYALALVAACIFAAFMIKKASVAYRRHQTEFHAQEAEMRRLKALKERYVPLTKTVLEQAEPAELLEGTALGLQLQLQKKENMEQAFLTLNEAQQYVYTLDVFLSDKTAEKFFKENGQLLIARIAPAFQAIGLTEFQETIEKLAVMFDENDETTSIDRNFVSAADEAFSAGDLLTKIKLQGANYIQNYPEMFCKND